MSQFYTGQTNFVPPSVPTEFDGNTGSAVPAANKLNILGDSGCTTSASGNTVSIHAPAFTDISGTTGLSIDSGYFVTAASTLTLPASPALGSLVYIIVDTASSVVVTANTGQVIRIGNNVSSTAGTATNSARGDVLMLRYRTTGAAWIAISEGSWTTA